MSNYTRREGTLGASGKRKDRDSSDPQPSHAIAKAELAIESTQSNNKLLAGYLAHEFLTRGTLFGKRFEPSRPESARPAPVDAGPEPPKPGRSYADVSYLLKENGAHLPGVVNPTQLARWLQM
ncbi:uncharacterized protein [Typha latifolia]|uniref:uncharacterized protein n=1 Tax=Typha latifolia TaxID=4733 RepID=UPI003C2B97F0